MLEIFTPPKDASEVLLCPDVLFISAPDGSARLLDLGGSFYAIDVTGASLLQGVLAVGKAAAVERVSAQFEVPRGQVRHDLDVLIAELQGEGLVLLSDELRPRRPAWAQSSIHACLSVLRNLCLGDRLCIWSLLVLAHFSLSLFGWSQTVAAWRFRFADSRSRSGDAHRISDLVRSIGARHWLAAECKERALCIWLLLQWNGIPSSLVVGIALYPFEGHCWCVCNDQVLGDDPERCEMFTPVITYD